MEGGWAKGELGHIIREKQIVLYVLLDGRWRLYNLHLFEGPECLDSGDAFIVIIEVKVGSG
jgi:hypothetical protein